MPASPAEPQICLSKGITVTVLWRMKRMIRWASDNGFDRLGWITGKDTADRYNLSKHVDEVEYFPETKRLIANKYEPLPTGRSAAIRLVDKEGYHSRSA